MEFDNDENSDGGLVPKFGAIFMSNIGTHRECIKRKLFGLPMAQANFVKQVRSGMILFLFEFERRELHGVFQATSDGIMNIMPHAFSSSGKQFPAQVRIAPIWSCDPLPEVVFRNAIKDNYYSPKKFNFGLSKNQVHLLLQLFYSTRLTNTLPQRQIANEISRGDRNKRHRLDDRIMVTDTFEQETRDRIKSPTSDELKENSRDRVERVNDGRFFTGDILEFIADSGLNHGTRTDNPDIHWTTKRKINDDVGVSMHDGVRFSEGDMVENVCVAESCIRPNFSSDNRVALCRSGQNVLMNFIETSSQSEQLYAHSVKPNLESLHYQLQHPSAFQSPNRSNSFTQTYLSSNDATRTVPYNPEFPDMNYQCSSHIMDSFQDYTSHQVFDENFLPLSTSESVTYEAERLAGRSDVYSGNGSDKFSFSSTCDHQILSSKGTNNTILKTGYPETTKSTTFIDKGDKGSSYSESSLARPSVFTRLSAAVEEHKNNDGNNNCMVHDECDMLASVSEVMDSLHQARNHWLKDKDYRPSLGQEKGREHVRCKEQSKFRNHKEIEQPVVTKVMGTDINHLTEGNSDVVPRETRVVDFKRRSKKSKKLDEMVTEDSTGRTVGITSGDSVKTSVDATPEALVGKPGKSRKLIRPDFSKTECPLETNNGDSTLYCRSREHFFCEDDSTNCQDACKSDAIRDMPSGNTGLVHANSNRSTVCEDNTSEQTPEFKESRNLKMLNGASNIHQEGSDGKERLQDMESVNEISEVPLGVTNQNVKNDLEIENQVKLSIQDLVSSLTSGTSAEHSPSLSVDITSVPPCEMHQNVMNELGVENPVKLSMQDIVSSTSAQQSPSLSTDVTAVPPSEINQNVKNGLGIENQVKLSIQDLVTSISTQHLPSFLADVTAISPSEVNQNVRNGFGIENQVKLSIKDLVSSLTSSSSGQDSLSSLVKDTAVPGKLEGKDGNEIKFAENLGCEEN